MIQVCDPPRARQVRRLSAEEFCTLVRGTVSSIYRPHSEVLRMLTAGEGWGDADAALLVLPMNADTAAMAALRAYVGWRNVAGSYVLAPPVGETAESLPPLLHAAAARAVHLARGKAVWAVLECTAQAQELLPLYMQHGFALRALRPLDSLAPCFLLTDHCTPVRTEPVWVPLEDRAHLALLLARGYAAMDCRPCQTEQGPVLAFYPVE